MPGVIDLKLGSKMRYFRLENWGSRHSRKEGCTRSKTRNKVGVWEKSKDNRTRMFTELAGKVALSGQKMA